jgi:putative methionine-R-sulfoxide reductase with GAF domain
VTTAALEAIDRILNRGGEPDEVLHAVVGTLVERGRCSWAGIYVADDRRLVPGPQAGEQHGEARVHVPILFGGRRVGELAADDCADRNLLERVALLVSPHCRVGSTTLESGWE